MNPQVRGLIEEWIDSYIGDAEIWVNYCRRFSPVISKEEDMTLGFIVGRLWETFYMLTRMHDRRNPSEEENLELLKLIDRRAMELMSAIRKALT